MALKVYKVTDKIAIEFDDEDADDCITIENSAMNVDFGCVAIPLEDVDKLHKALKDIKRELKV